MCRISSRRFVYSSPPPNRCSSADDGGAATAHHGDVTNFDYVESLLSETVDAHGQVDFVANFAGILRDGVSYKLSKDDWRAVMETNLTGQFALLQALA